MNFFHSLNRNFFYIVLFPNKKSLHDDIDIYISIVYNKKY